MTKTSQTERHLHLVPAPKKSSKSIGDCFRTEAAQDVFRARWNAAQAKLAQR